MKPRIALIHATPVAMAPVRAAFAAAWPDAETMDLLDDSLSRDRAKSKALTDAVSARICDLAHYARKAGADGILYTCSAFGEAIDQAAREVDVPVLKPNEAMFERAMECGPCAGMIATFGPAVAGMEEEFRDEAARRGIKATLTTRLVAPAMEALRAGDAEAHNRLVADAAPGLGDCDSIMLAHFSTSRAAEAVQLQVRTTVLTSPDAAVAKMRHLLEAA